MSASSVVAFPPQATPEGYDLLRIPGLRWLVMWRGFPYVFQAPLLALLIVLMVKGWGLYTPVGVNAKLYAKSNLVTLLIWGLWWPLIVWITVLFGRAWCLVCPLELVSNGFERLARWLGIALPPMRRWISGGAIIVALYLLIQLSVAGAQLHRIPAYTAYYILGLIILAAASALIWKDRAFCRGLCPVGMLLGVYGRGGMVALRASSQEVCQACAGKYCLVSANRYLLDGRSCPSLLNPAKLNDNRDCLVCAQCIKACKPDNLRLALRLPFSGRDVRTAMASWPATLFVMMVSGFVLYELASEWPAAQVALLAIPDACTKKLGAPAWLTGYLKGVWTLVLVPLVSWSVLGIATMALGTGSRLTEVWRRMALPVAVIVAAGHMAKGLAKFTSWAGFFRPAWSAPAGVDMAVGITKKTLAEPASALAIGLVSWVGMALIAGALLLAIRETRLTDPGARRGQLIPLAVFAGVFLFITYGWGLQSH